MKRTLLLLTFILAAVLVMLVFPDSVLAQPTGRFRSFAQIVLDVFNDILRPVFLTAAISSGILAFFIERWRGRLILLFFILIAIFLSPDIYDLIAGSTGGRIQ